MNRIPAALRKYAAQITDCDVDMDGWKWVYLAPGWIYDGVHQIAYGTWKECAASFSMVEPCDCQECRDLADRAKRGVL
jgi:hypothetical protein